MKFLSFLKNNKSCYGVMTDHGIVDLSPRLGHDFPTLRDLLAAGALDRARSIAGTASPDVAVEDIVFLPPIPHPEKIICVGVNYAKRNAEYKDNSDLPKYPSIFTRTPGSLVGHKVPVVRPPESTQLDYEGEIAIIVGASGRRIPEDRAGNYIAGLTVMNEGTVRDWLRHGKFNVTQGKNFERSGSMGPWMVTTDEFPSFDDLRLKTWVNGEIRQDDTTANIIFRFPYLLRYISTFMALKAGDVIATGTPIGAGVRFDPPRFLKPGDIIEIEVSGIGRLTNGVVDEAP
ncbi:MAG TPA: fumarylacetoacetate hydrolase family protein [Thermodesulfobacteriota bacterium]|nr:fumarylacetoacetate hydrolase family protein [Thermodesulfobacteriota bacterium]